MICYKISECTYGQQENTMSARTYSSFVSQKMVMKTLRYNNKTHFSLYFTDDKIAIKMC